MFHPLGGFPVSAVWVTPRGSVQRLGVGSAPRGALSVAARAEVPCGGTSNEQRPLVLKPGVLPVIHVLPKYY